MAMTFTVTLEKIEWVEIEAVFTKQITQIAWRELTDSSLWLQGWK